MMLDNIDKEIIKTRLTFWEKLNIKEQDLLRTYIVLDESSRSKNDIIFSTHDQIVKHLGSAIGVVSRMLKYFSKEGFVELSRGKIKIIDKDVLREIVKNV